MQSQIRFTYVPLSDHNAGAAPHGAVYSPLCGPRSTMRGPLLCRFPRSPAPPNPISSGSYLLPCLVSYLPYLLSRYCGKCAHKSAHRQLREMGDPASPSLFYWHLGPRVRASCLLLSQWCPAKDGEGSSGGVSAVENLRLVVRLESHTNTVKFHPVSPLIGTRSYLNLRIHNCIVVS